MLIGTKGLSFRQLFGDNLVCLLPDPNKPPYSKTTRNGENNTILPIKFIETTLSTITLAPTSASQKPPPTTH